MDILSLPQNRSPSARKKGDPAADSFFVLQDEPAFDFTFLHALGHSLTVVADRNRNVEGHLGIAGPAAMQPIFPISGFRELDSFGRLLSLDQ